MKEEAILFGGNGLGYVLTALQTNEVFQIIELVLSILLTCVLLAFRLWKWYKEAKKDGKIDSSEIQEGIDILEKGKEEIEKKSKNGGDEE